MYFCIIYLGPSSVFKIVKMIMERNFQPVIIFSFSKKDCEAYALQVSKLDFNNGMGICEDLTLIFAFLISNFWSKNSILLILHNKTSD